LEAVVSQQVSASVDLHQEQESWCQIRRCRTAEGNCSTAPQHFAGFLAAADKIITAAETNGAKWRQIKLSKVSDKAKQSHNIQLLSLAKLLQTYVQTAHVVAQSTLAHARPLADERLREIQLRQSGNRAAKM
jgi:hypothetical protein